MIHLKELTDYLQAKENIYLYGAGKVAKRLAAYLEQENFKVCGYIVTKRQNSSAIYNEKPLWELSELPMLPVPVSSVHIIVAIRGRCLDIKQFSINIGMKSILFLNDKILDELLEWDWEHTYHSLQSDYILMSKYPRLEIGMELVFDKQEKCSLFRVFRLNADPIILAEHCTQRSFESQFGPLQVFDSSVSTAFRNRPVPAKFVLSKNAIELYVATSHLDSMSVAGIQETSWNVYPLQVGASLTSIRKGCQTDNTGTHISLKNPDFCECTGLYWIWKNTSSQKYVGLEQYRRRLKLDVYDLFKLEEYGIDAVLALPQFVMKKVKDFFAGDLITEYDWTLMKESILNYDENYRSILNVYDESWFYFSCNLFLFKREWFDRYCEFAFSVAFQIDNFYSQKGIIRQDRYMGYIFENLLSVFMMRHYKEMNVICTEVEWIE